MSVVAFVASAATEPRNRIVFVNERSGLVGVACYALALEGDLSDLTGLRWVDRMAIAAGELALGNRVMIVQPELGKLGRVTLAAKCDFVGLEQQLLVRLLGQSNEASRIFRLTALESTALQIQLRVRMDLMARHA